VVRFHEPHAQIRVNTAAVAHRSREGAAGKAKTVLVATAVIAFFGAIAAERGAHHSTSSGTQPTASSDESDDFGFFDDGGLAPSQGQPSTSTHTS